MSKVCLRLVTSDLGRWTLDIGLVDPTGLKPAPNGLKVRCSVTRAPGHKSPKSHVQSPKSLRRISMLTLDLGRWTLDWLLAVAEGFEPSHGRINSAVPYQLGYATKERMKAEG
jgi:hypothetical protein